MHELSDKELELLAEQLVDTNQLTPEIQTPCRYVFKMISWGFFLLCFNFTFFSFDCYPYFSLIGSSFLVFGFWHFANENIYFEKVWKTTLFIMAARILILLFNSTSILYEKAIFFTLPLNILVFAGFYKLFQNFELGLDETDIAVDKNILHTLKHDALVLLVFPLFGTLLQDTIFQFVLLILYMAALILLLRALLRLGHAMDALCYTINRRNPREIQTLKRSLWVVSIFSVLTMFLLMLIPTQKHSVLPASKAQTSQLSDYKEFQDILHELPDSELEYYQKPIKNVQTALWETENMVCTTYFTEFEEENGIEDVRFLYRITYKETAFRHRFHTNGYIALENGGFPDNDVETTNVFYYNDGHTYSTKRINNMSSNLFGSAGYIGGEVPEYKANTSFYLGVSQHLQGRLNTCSAVYYFKGMFPYWYPYKPASQRAMVGNRSECFYTLFDLEICRIQWN